MGDMVANLAAHNVPNHSDVQTMHRGQKVSSPVIRKGYSVWTKEEDELMIDLMAKCWAAFERSIPGRTGKQCRERWINHLDPAIRKGKWSKEEDVCLYLAHGRFGNKWAQISKLLPGRSQNAVKIRWNKTMKNNIKEMEAYCVAWCAEHPTHVPAQQEPVPSLLVQPVLSVELPKCTASHVVSSRWAITDGILRSSRWAITGGILRNLVVVMDHNHKKITLDDFLQGNIIL